MTNIEQIRKEFDKLLISKEFRLTDDEVIKEALKSEKSMKKSQVA